MTEDEMVGWHHRLDGHEFKQASGVGDGQESLACCSPWGRRESDTIDRLNCWCPTESWHHFITSLPLEGQLHSGGHCSPLLAGKSVSKVNPTSESAPNSITHSRNVFCFEVGFCMVVGLVCVCVCVYIYI